MVRDMALQTTRTDDLDGSPGAVTTVITVNGIGIEIDLGDKSAKALTKALDVFWRAGSPSEYVVTKRERGAPSKAKTNGRAYDLAELRQWAETNGVKLPQRGRIPQAIVEQYLRA